MGFVLLVTLLLVIATKLLLKNGRNEKDDFDNDDSWHS